MEEVEDRDSARAPRPLAWGRILAQVDMPSMTSMPRFEEIAHREGIPGVFGVHPTLPHGGDYRLCLTILPPEIPLPGHPAPSSPLAFEFPLSVGDAPASPHRESAKVKPYALDLIATPRHPVAGEPVDLELRVRLAGSLDLREVVDFDIQHERRMHLFVISSDRARFDHVHPELSGPGVFRLSYRFPAPGRYLLFVDVAPSGAGSQVVASKLEVGGTAAGAPPGAPKNRTKAAVAVALETPEGGLHAGRTATLRARLIDSAGRPVRDLEAWLGAIAHLMLLHEDAETFAHAHPDDREPAAGRDGRIPFVVRLPRPGAYKGWLQFQRGGRVETLAVEVEAGP